MAAWRSTCWAGSPYAATAARSRPRSSAVDGCASWSGSSPPSAVAVVSRDALIEALWGEQLPADPATNLNVVVNRARRALGEPELIQTGGGGYLLRDGTEVVVDVERFEELVGQARAAHGRGDHVSRGAQRRRRAGAVGRTASRGRLRRLGAPAP